MTFTSPLGQKAAERRHTPRISPIPRAREATGGYITDSSSLRTRLVLPYPPWQEDSDPNRSGEDAPAIPVFGYHYDVAVHRTH